MKLDKVLDKLNSIEKISFSKILDSIINGDSKPKKIKEINSILNNYSDTDIKKLDSKIVAKVFDLVKMEYSDYLNKEINKSVSQLDILIDILIRDGNSIMKREWIDKLYEQEVKKIRKKIREQKEVLNESDLEAVDKRDRDYLIYRNCIHTAYHNDISRNQDPKITLDEKSILNALATSLDLSQEEVKLLKYSVLPLKVLSIDELIDLLKNTGIVLYSKRHMTVYVPDEFVRLLRVFRNKEVADKYFKRILKLLKDPQINLVCRKHAIDRKQDRKHKIKAIVSEGIGFRNLLKIDIYKEGVSKTDKKKTVNNLVEKGLLIDHLKGTTIDSKLDNLIHYFNEIELEEKVGISLNGYNQLLADLSSTIPKLNRILKDEFELQAENVCSPNLLLDYNIKPRDVLETLSIDQIKLFCNKRDISRRGNEMLNILNSYTDAKNIQLENYEHIGFRNLIALKENGVSIKESEIGLKFEELTKQIFSELGLQVNEKLRKEVSTSKDKIDVLLSIKENEVILIECKSVRENGYNKFKLPHGLLKNQLYFFF